MGYGYGGYYAQQGPQRAVEHPSANTAVILALLGTFCLGALTGVPAIFLGRSVIRAIELEPRRWTGGGTARVALAFGWISVFETAFVVTMMVARGYLGASLGLVVGIAGLVLVVLSGLDSLPLRWLRGARIALGVPLGGVLVASAVGLSVASAKDAADVRRCEAARAQYPVALKSESFGTARNDVDDILLACKGSSSEVAALRKEIEAKEAEVTKRKAQEEADRQAALAAEKETKAVESFPAASKTMGTLLKSAQSRAWAGKWEDSERALDDAQAELDRFKGTSVEASKDFVSLTKQIETQRKGIQPQLDAIAAKARKEAAAEALTAALRGPKPTNSAWDGSIHVVERAIKDAMNDPDSYEHVGTTEPVAEGEYWTCVTRFRGKNAFGGKVVNTRKVWIQGGEVVRFGEE